MSRFTKEITLTPGRYLLNHRAKNLSVVTDRKKQKLQLHLGTPHPLATTERSQVVDRLSAESPRDSATLSTTESRVHSNNPPPNDRKNSAFNCSHKHPVE